MLGRKLVDRLRELKMIFHTRWFKDNLNAIAAKVDEKTNSILYGLVDAVVRQELGLDDVRNMMFGLLVSTSKASN